MRYIKKMHFLLHSSQNCTGPLVSNLKIKSCRESLLLLQPSSKQLHCNNICSRYLHQKMRRLDYHYTISSVVKWIKYVLECLRIYMRTSITKLKLFGLGSTRELTVNKVWSNSPIQSTLILLPYLVQSNGLNMYWNAFKFT